MKYKVSAKRNDKWWTFGAVKENQYGNLQLSMKNTPELKEHILQGGEWLNFSLFEDKPKEVAPETQAKIDALKNSAAEDSEIPF